MAGRVRQRSQESSGERRDALLRAAVAIIGESGVSAATHRAIAQRARVSLPSTNYYFGSIDQLIEMAFRQWARERARGLEQVAVKIAEGSLTPNELLDVLVAALLHADRTGDLAQYEAYLHAARYPSLQDAVADCMAAFERVAVTALTAVGVRDPVPAARAIVAYCDGFCLSQLAHPRADAEQTLREGLLGLTIAALIDDEERDRLAARAAAHLRTGGS